MSRTTWFKVDDRFPESDKVIELTLRPEGLAALGLWTLCGAWAAGRGNGGRIPEAVVKRYRGTRRHVAALVDVGLWDPSDDDWQFHDWDDYNESAEAAEAVKIAEREAGRRGNHERWHVRRRIVVPSCQFCVGSPMDGESGGDRVPDSGAIPPGPGPDPEPEKTDGTNAGEVSHETDAGARDDDPIEAGFTALGVASATARGRVLAAVRTVVPTASDAEVVDVVRGILDRSDDHVRYPVAYVETACRETPATVLDVWERSPRPSGVAA